MVENLIFGKTRFKTSVFEKHFISYSCILFINFNVLRSFCIKLLCFSKNYVFQIFDRSNLFFDRSKMRLKFWFELEVLNRCWINRKWFSIDRKLYREFFKTLSFHIICHFQTFSKTFFSLSSIGQGFQSIFCHFPPILLQGFCLHTLVRPLYPSFFIYFHSSCIFFMHLRVIFEPKKLWGFWLFLSQLITGFLLLDDINMILVV